VWSLEEVGRDMATKADLTTEEKIKKEFNRLRRIFRNIPKDKMNTAISLIRNAAFMTVTLDSLQETINLEGTVSKYQNGENQWGTKKSPEVEIHIAMTKNHLAVIKQLCDLLPDADKAKEEADELAKFVKQASR
jgi:hypothetical protein